jgi:hypothetical protein
MRHPTQPTQPFSAHRTDPSSPPAAPLPQLVCAARTAVQAHCSDLESVARTLARLGYSVKLCTSAGGSLHSLKHTFIMAARHAAAASHGEQPPDSQPAGQPDAAPQRLPSMLLLSPPASVLTPSPLPAPPHPASPQVRSRQSG